MEMKRWVIDAGNTSVKLASFSGPNGEMQVRRDMEGWKWAENEARMSAPLEVLVAASGVLSEEWEVLLAGLEGRVIRAVAHGEMGERVRAAARKAGLRSHYETLETLGLDRLGNTLEGARFRPTGAVLVVDAGTCLTMDWIVNGIHLGGTISPGANMRLASMHEGTARLPDVRKHQTAPRTSSRLPVHAGESCRTTLQSIEAGAWGGLRAEITQRVAAGKTIYPDLRVVLTGGDIKFLELGLSNRIFADANWTLKGYFHLLRHFD
jgi:type III pantothenate kinase